MSDVRFFSDSINREYILRDAIIVSGELCINCSSDRGRHLMSLREYANNELICSAATCKIDSDARKRLQKYDFHKFVFLNPSDFRVSSCCDGYLAFGPMAFCNHADDPNAYIEWDVVSGFTVIHLRALDRIRPGSEITMQYANITEYHDVENWS